MSSPKKPSTPPTSQDGPLSDRARAQAYRLRLRMAGGVRLTLNPNESSLVREALRFALERQLWSTEDRAALEGVRRVLRERGARARKKVPADDDPR